MNWDYRPVKRGLDIATAAIGLLVSAPIMATTAILVRTRLGAPVIFKQQRPGLNGKPFQLYKFRTMLTPNVHKGLVSNEDRITPFGARLRSTSLDELPTLWNVLRGEMSIVGPRPLRMSYVKRFSDEQSVRQNVRPGVTGLAQVSGRNAISWDDRLELDRQYVRRISPSLDFWILMRTIKTVLSRENVTEDGQATMSEFFGPERTSRLKLTPLGENYLADRVDWLSDPTIRSGITITYWPTIRAMSSWWASASQDESRGDWVAVDSHNRPQAMCGLTNISHDSADLYIYVNPHAQRLGFGRETMQLLMAKARSLGLSLLRLETKTSNQAARRMYERLGFDVDEERTSSEKIGMHIALSDREGTR